MIVPLPTVPVDPPLPRINQEMLDGLTFVFAKTMPTNPHYWVKRTAENELAYVTLFHTFWRDGSWQRFGRGRYRVWCWGDWFYWPMTNKIQYSIIMNRQRMEVLAARDPVEAERLRALDWSKRAIEPIDAALVWSSLKLHPSRSMSAGAEERP